MIYLLRYFKTKQNKGNRPQCSQHLLNNNWTLKAIKCFLKSAAGFYMLPFICICCIWFFFCQLIALFSFRISRCRETKTLPQVRFKTRWSVKLCLLTETFAQLLDVLKRAKSAKDDGHEMVTVAHDNIKICDNSVSIPYHILLYFHGLFVFRRLIDANVSPIHTSLWVSLTKFPIH